MSRRLRVIVRSVMARRDWCDLPEAALACHARTMAFLDRVVAARGAGGR